MDELEKTAAQWTLDQMDPEARADEIYAVLKAEVDILNAMLSDVKELVIQQFQQDPDSIHSVLVVPTKGRKTTAWAQVAKEVDVPKEIIEKYTKISEPGFTIRQLSEQDKKTGDGKFISA